MDFVLSKNLFAGFERNKIPTSAPLFQAPFLSKTSNVRSLEDEKRPHCHFDVAVDWS